MGVGFGEQMKTNRKGTDIFVFGSNLAGRHGAGSALAARLHHGAVYGRGIGPQGMSYAIPTKDFELKRMSLEEIKANVDDFIKYAEQHPELVFHVVRVGCGLAGYTDKEIAPMFVGAPANCKLHRAFLHEIALFQSAQS